VLLLLLRLNQMWYYTMLRSCSVCTVFRQAGPPQLVDCLARGSAQIDLRGPNADV